MIFHKFKAKVISHLSYLVGSDGEAFVVDPMRDSRMYMDKALEEGLNIKYIFETHRNEDYVIGSLELAEITGAEIYHGIWPDFKYGNIADDGEEFKVGKLKATVLHTPGHTPGCISIAVADTAMGEETVLVCTGDTLFVGDVGRTDFGGPEKRWEWSENLYNSIYDKLMSLGDHVVICPAHGSGSVCGGGIADRELSTIGLERLMNKVLQKSRDEFIKYKVEEHHEYAPYFHMMEKYNVEGAPFVGCGPTPKALKPKEFKAVMEEGAIVIDTRPPPAFGVGHIKNSYSLYLNRLGMGGWVLPYDRPILLVIGDMSHLDYVTRSFMRLGYDNVPGYLAGTISSWYKEVLPVEKLGMLTVTELKEKVDTEDWFILDVRSREEYDGGHIEGSLNIYVGLLPQHLEKIPKDRPVAVLCKSGTRSSFACSILLREGWRNSINILGGMSSWEKAGYPVER